MSISQYDQLNYAQFKPLSIQEIWAPSQQMRAQHDQLAEEYAAQEAAGGIASLGLQKGVDDVAIVTNQNFINETKKAADELMTKGYNDAGRRKNLYALKQQYIQNVLPIQNALKVREEALKFDRERKAKDITYESAFDIASTPITKYFENTNAFNPNGVSKGELFKDNAMDFSNLRRSVSMKHPELKNTGVIGKLWTIVNSDVSAEEVAGFIRNESKNLNINPEVLTSIGQVMHNIPENNLKKHGVYETFKDSPSKINEMRKIASSAAIYAIDEPKFGQMDDIMRLHKEQNKDNQNDPGWIPDVKPIPEIEQEGKFKENLDIINLLESGKIEYGKESLTKEQLAAKIDVEKKLTPQERADFEIMRKDDIYKKAHPNFLGLSSEGYNSKESRDASIRNSSYSQLIKYNTMYPKSARSQDILIPYAKKYKMDDPKKILQILKEENEKLKVAVSEIGIDTEGNTAFKAAYKENSHLFKDFKEDNSKKIDADAISIKWSPTLGVIARGFNKENKSNRIQLPSSILGNPELVKKLNVDVLPKLTSQILNGKVNIREMIKEGELVESKNNKGYYIFAKPVVNSKYVPIGYLQKVAYSEEEINSALQNHPEIIDYLSQRNGVVANTYNNRLNTVNTKNILNPNK